MGFVIKKIIKKGIYTMTGGYAWQNFEAFNNGLPEPPFSGNIISLSVGNFSNFPKSIWAIEEKAKNSKQIWRWDYDKDMNLSYAQVGGDLDIFAVRFALESGVFAPQVWGFSGSTLKYWPASSPVTGNNWVTLQVAPEGELPSAPNYIACSNDFGIFAVANNNIYQWEPSTKQFPKGGGWALQQIPFPTGLPAPKNIQCIAVSDTTPWNNVNGFIWAVDEDGTFWCAGQWNQTFGWAWNHWVEIKKPPSVTDPTGPFTSYNLKTVSASAERDAFTLCAIDKKTNMPMGWQFTQMGWQFVTMLSISPFPTPKMSCMAVDGFGWIWGSSDGAQYLQYYISV